MNFYWIYDIPSWQLALLMITTLVTLAVMGLLVCRPLTRRLLKGSGQHNDVTSYFISGVSVLISLTLGLIAVATYQNYTDADGKVAREANELGALYRDLDGYPQPLRGELEDQLRHYTTFVIEKQWPAHRRGEVLEEGTEYLEDFENRMMAFEPSKEREKIAHAEVIDSLDALTQARTARLQAVTSGLPAILWVVLIIGAGLNVGMTYLFWVDNLPLHVLLVVALASSLALLIFLIAVMDNPFRGEFSVSPDSFRYVLDHVMKPVTRAG
jgi:hypothetical protein